MANTYTINKTDFLQAVKSTENSLANLNVKQKALKMLDNMDLPHRKIEAWRHINLEQLFAQQYTTAPKQNISKATIDSLRIYSAAHLLVFVNGEFQHAFSDASHNQIIHGSMADPTNQKTDAFQKHFESTALHKKNIFTALNTAYSADGAFIYVPRSKALETEIHIMHIVTANIQNTLAQNRSLIILDNNAQAKITQSFHSLSLNTSLYNSATEIILGTDANLTFSTLQNEGNHAFFVNHTKVQQAKNSSFTANTITLNGEIVRNEIEVNQNAEHCQTQLNGLYLPKENQQVDNNLLVNHLRPNGNSDQLYRGIMDDSSHASFLGKVYIAPDAQHIDANQSNNNVLLTETARANSKPQLEIYADDVSCTHGSTTGQLDKEGIFYLQTRGISQQQARIMILNAFIHEVIDRITDQELHDYVAKVVTERLLPES